MVDSLEFDSVAQVFGNSNDGTSAMEEATATDVVDMEAANQAFLSRIASETEQVDVEATQDVEATAATWRLASDMMEADDSSPTIFVGDVVQQQDEKVQEAALNDIVAPVVNVKDNDEETGFAFVDDNSDDENQSAVFTISDDEESQFTTNDCSTVVSTLSEKPDGVAVRSHAYDLLKRISEENPREGGGSLASREPSINSRKSAHTEASSSKDQPESSTSLQAPPRSRKFWLMVVAILLVVVIGLVVAVVMVTSKDSSSSTPTSYDPDDFDFTYIGTQAPTNPLELPDETSSKKCQTLEGRANVQVFEAEDAEYYIGDAAEVNSTVSHSITGYCGDGFVNGFTSSGSRYVLGYLEVEESGMHFLSLRYSNADLQAHEMIVSMDSIPVAFFELEPTEDASTWAIESISNILLKDGSHYVEVWTRQDIDDTNQGPNIDWVSLQLHRPMSRSEYLLDIISAEAGQEYDPQVLSWAQNASLAWMQTEDQLSWSTVTPSELKERFVLVQFFFSTSGKHWLINDGWLSERHVCDWFGIVCGTAGDDRIKQDKLVTDLIIDGNGLLGLLPSDIYLLDELQVVNLDQNHMEGALSIEKLPPMLTSLSLDSNYLSGTIPFAAMVASPSPSQLKHLSLGNNRLNGPLSNELYALTSLTSISLPNNALTGKISNEIGRTLVNLQTFNAESNSLTGTIPATLGVLSDLQTLKLNENAFSGTVPQSLLNRFDIVV